VSGGRQGRTSRLLALIIVNFVAFWLPWNVLSLVVEFDRTAVPVDLFRLLDLAHHHHHHHHHQRLAAVWRCSAFIV